MRTFLLLSGILTGSLLAQTPLGIIEGHFLSLEDSQIQIQLANGKTMPCAVDGRTYLDRERRRLALKDLKAGDFLELVTERHGPLRPCFARMIHVSAGQLRFGGRFEVGQVKRATETISPRGNVNLSGLVRDLQQHWLEIRTRQGEVFRLKLRPDTVFSRDGVRVTQTELAPNQRVNVRCGYSLDGELEAYHLVWGDILPRIIKD